MIVHPEIKTDLGVLYRGDCIEIMREIPDQSIDTVFADPPFNIGKKYDSGINDMLSEDEYITWTKRWVNECVRVLKPGGSLFVYNIPKWNIIIGSHLLQSGLHFRHWIAISMKCGLPIQGRLYPAHYGLLYFSKGKPKTFRKIRTPIEQCRHCGGDIKDYGGHRKELNPLGLNLMDVWTDIGSVSHRKFKSEKRKANTLSTKILERIVEMSTRPGDCVLDPFGGSGTTYAVCEKKNRRWIGIEIGACDVIIERLTTNNQEFHKNTDLVEEDECDASSSSDPTSTARSTRPADPAASIGTRPRPRSA